MVVGKRTWLTIFSIASFLFLQFIGCNGDNVPFGQSGESQGTENAANEKYDKISIVGEINIGGIADPSVEYDEKGEIGWLTYSSLKSSPGSPPEYIYTHLAKTTDHGQTWRFVKRINASSEETVQVGDKSIVGIWHNEVSTLVHDPTDKGKEWKLFWHKYLSVQRPDSKKRDRNYDLSWIMYKGASTPEALASAQEVRLFGSGRSPSQFKAKYNLNEIINWPRVTAYSEIGSLCKDGVLYMSIATYIHGDLKQGKICLLSSSDHGETWKHVSYLVDHEDALKLDKRYVTITGSSLAEEDGRVFLLTSPIGKVNLFKGGHLGMVIFEFDDISKGTLLKDAGGKLIIRRHLKRQLPGIFNAGQGDYDEHNTAGGIIMPQVNPKAAPEFGQIFSTKARIIDSK